jgi:SPP1 family predicted phage head-tail adaptor
MMPWNGGSGREEVNAQQVLQWGHSNETVEGVSIMRIGRMRQRVTLQSLVETTDSYGQRIESWVTQGTYWAFLSSLSGRELVNAQQAKADVTHFLQMRYVGSLLATPGALPSMRILFNGRVFNLSWVNNVDERNKTYEILAQEVAAAVPS